MSTIAIADCFAADGPLARAVPGYQPRPSQARMAEAVWQAIQGRGRALIEAPTGTGKSLAYLIPALLSGKTVVVATANKSLQAQLFLKDLPLAARALGLSPSAVLVKGRHNFICRWKWDREAIERQLLARIEGPGGQVAALDAWLKETASGDVDELPFLLAPDLGPRVVSLHDDCIQQACAYHAEDCFVNRMRDEAAGAQVLITNHHLLLTALQLGEAGARLLPAADLYVIDEAHHLVDTATSVFSVEVSDHAVEGLLARAVYGEHIPRDRLDDLRFQARAAFDELIGQAREAGGEAGGAWRVEAELPRLKALAAALKAEAQIMADKRPYGRSEPALQPAPAGAGAVDEVEAAWRSMKRLPPLRTLSGAGKAGSELDEAALRQLYDMGIGSLNGLADDLLVLASARRDDRVLRYAEPVRGRRHVRMLLRASPISPAEALAEHLFDAQGRTVICTSATLAASDGFATARRQLGIDAEPPQEVTELVTETVFDYGRQSLLYQPALPAYRWEERAGYYDAVAGEIERLLSASRGRALCLFTSWAGLTQTAERLRGKSIWPLRAQGDAPREALLAWFRGTAGSVLLATRAFWEGVDIQGDDLSLVVMDKLPFPSPTDPLHGARMRAVEAAGRRSFEDYLLPQMTLTLKQGFGRLIRTDSDRGVVAILDERLTSKGYGSVVRRALPPAPLTRGFGDVARFFDAGRAAGSEGGRVDFALELGGAGQATVDAPAEQPWRWTLRRMVDGKADSAAGLTDQVADPVSAEFYAGWLGLRDLADRVRRAGRRPEEFSVELRCSQRAAGWVEGAASLPPDAFGDKGFRPADWLAEAARWRSLGVWGVAVEEVAAP